MNGKSERRQHPGPFSRDRASARPATRDALHPDGAWLLAKMGFEAAHFHGSAALSTLVDNVLAVETVAYEYALLHFEQALDAIDPRLDAASSMGRIISCIYLEGGPDWPLGRSWFHDLFLTLARAEGALGIDLSSEPMLKVAVDAYLKEFRALIDGHVLLRNALASADYAEQMEGPTTRVRQAGQLRLL